MKQIVIAFIFLLALVALYLILDAFNPFNDEPDQGGVFCTLDAKVCPDGSYVGRVAPSCEFAPCPEGQP